MPRSLRLAGLAAALIVIGVLAAVAQAATSRPATTKPPGERPGFDIRGAKASSPAGARTARATLLRSLGDGGTGAADPATGNLRIVAARLKPLSGAGGSAAGTVLGYVRRHRAAHGGRPGGIAQ